MRLGDPVDSVPGQVIVIPETLKQVRGKVQDIERLRVSYLKNAAKRLPVDRWSESDVAFVAADLKADVGWVKQKVAEQTEVSV